jgi:hypothetical protein
MAALLGCDRQPTPAQLSQSVGERMFRNPQLKDCNIEVEAESGVVTLRGEVHDESEKSLAAQIAGEVPGVKQVVLSLTVMDAEGDNPALGARLPVQSSRLLGGSASAQNMAPSSVASSSRDPFPKPHHAATPAVAWVAPHAEAEAAIADPPPTHATSPAALNTASWTNPIDRYLARKPQPSMPSPMLGNGPAFEADGKQYTIDPRLIVAISGAETSLATGKCHTTPVSSTRNAWNWFYCYGSNSCGEDVCVNSPFNTWQSGICTVSKYVQRNYIMKGFTDVRRIQSKYCTSGCDHWVGNVEAVMRDLGGDPETLTAPAP